jgi:hypothetical protein
MLTLEEENFIQYWEQNKDVHGTFMSKILRGLPMAFVFGLPILLLIIVVYLFIPDWYIKISKTSPQAFFVVVIAVIIAIIFYAFTRMHFKWEMNNQIYQELKQKQKKADAAKT